MATPSRIYRHRFFCDRKTIGEKFSASIDQVGTCWQSRSADVGAKHALRQSSLLAIVALAKCCGRSTVGLPLIFRTNSLWLSDDVRQCAAISGTGVGHAPAVISVAEHRVEPPESVRTRGVPHGLLWFRLRLLGRHVGKVDAPFA